MKHIGKTLLRALLFVVLFSSLTLVLSTAGVTIVSEAKAEVKSSDVILYLENLGYTIRTIRPVEDNEDWECTTTLNGHNYLTIVHVEGTEIIDHEDISI